MQTRPGMARQRGHGAGGVALGKLQLGPDRKPRRRGRRRLIEGRKQCSGLVDATGRGQQPGVP